MGILKKVRYRNAKPKYCVVKLFKIIHQSDRIDIGKCLDIMLPVFASSGYHLSEISVNYDSKRWKTLAQFYKFSAGRDVIEFTAQFDPEASSDNKVFTGIYYSNALLNQIKKTTEKDYVEFKLVVPYEWYSLDVVKTVVKEIDTAIGLLYAYVCFLPQNYCVVTERAERTGVTKEDHELRNKLRDIDCGFVPKIYPVNFLNSEQVKNIDEDMDSFEKISDNLTLVIRTL